MIEFVLQVIGEFLIQIVVETLLELGLHSLAEPFRKPPNPWLASLGFVLFGTVFGCLSLFAFRSSFIPPGSWRLVNLALTPVATGVAMSFMGAWRSTRSESVLRIDKFAYGYLFALSFGLVRFCFAI